jgi:hypothetical protein
MADGPAGLIANPADNTGKRKRLPHDFKRRLQITPADFGHHPPHIHMDRAGSRAGGRIFLDAAVFQFFQFSLVHGGGLFK